MFSVVGRSLRRCHLSLFLEMKLDRQTSIRVVEGKLPVTYRGTCSQVNEIHVVTTVFFLLGSRCR